ncbi:MAG: Purine catabolism regulatory protein [Firmicutes bacterium ADurb.Bin182]|nr:MAG: Purine catabolism regulatory protein [Firmicutes bacterium ADurb.Bin182]
MLEDNALNTIRIPLYELLELPVFEGSRVLGGAEGLSLTITGINLTDTPDYYNWINEGELMVTTCYAISGDAGALSRFIPTLYEKGLSGVCIKPRRFIEAIPRGMIADANKLCFPLIELPEDIHFSRITKAVSDMMLHHQTDLLMRISRVNDLLVKTIVEGASLNEIAQMISSLVESTVLIMDSINGRKAIALTPAAKLAFSGMNVKEQDIGRIITENSHVHPLHVENRPFGYIYIYDQQKPLSKFNESMIDKLSQTIPLEISRVRSLRENEDVHFKDFFMHILNDKITDEAREKERAQSFGLDAESSHMILRLTVSETKDASTQYSSMLQRTLLFCEIRTTLQNIGISSRLVHDEDQFLLILSSSEDGRRFTHMMDRFFCLLENIMSQYPTLKLTMGYSRSRIGLSGLIESDREARIALRAASSVHKAGGIVSFGDMDLFRLIYADDPNSEISAFIDETIGKLIDPSHPKGKELLNTLESYIKNYGNVKRVSEETFTHYNTVVYRLNSIKEATGLDLRVPEQRFRLETALNLYRLLS